MTLKEEKIWVVIEKTDGDALDATAYDNEADANNYCQEMRALHENPSYGRIVMTDLIRRNEAIPSDDTPWGALRMDIKSEFVEGLMEDMVPLDQIRPGAAERFLHDKIEMVRRRTLEHIETIVKKETKEELIMAQDEWAHTKDMED
ncbi:MAG: hypothetical protein LBT23_08565 [Synergistaceae bacterium]|jgi:hypothetical protein|nr:hypothetical protein [Synergistaceae bacterium]